MHIQLHTCIVVPIVTYPFFCRLDKYCIAIVIVGVVGGSLFASRMRSIDRVENWKMAVLPIGQSRDVQQLKMSYLKKIFVPFVPLWGEGGEGVGGFIGCSINELHWRAGFYWFGVFRLPGPQMGQAAHDSLIKLSEGAVWTVFSCGHMCSIFQVFGDIVVDNHDRESQQKSRGKIFTAAPPLPLFSFKFFGDTWVGSGWWRWWGKTAERGHGMYLCACMRFFLYFFVAPLIHLI